MPNVALGATAIEVGLETATMHREVTDLPQDKRPRPKKPKEGDPKIAAVQTSASTESAVCAPQNEDLNAVTRQT